MNEEQTLKLILVDSKRVNVDSAVSAIRDLPVRMILVDELDELIKVVETGVLLRKKK